MRLRTLVLLTVLLAAVVSVYGQVTVTQPTAHVFLKQLAFDHDSESEAVNDQFIQSTRSALSLSDAQVNALKVLLTMRGQAMEKHFIAMDEAEHKLDEVMSQRNPNPTEVGTAYLASRNVHEQLQAAEEKFRTDFKAMLSASQQAALEKFKTASEQIHSLAELGILDASAHHEAGMEMHSQHMFAIDLPHNLSNVAR